MDKNTLSNYGWVVIAVLVLSVMIALATPFGTYIRQGVESTTAGLFDTSEKAMNVVGMSAGSGNFEDGSGNSGTPSTPIDYEIIEGANQTVATIEALFRSTADYNKFESVKVDNNIVNPSNYSVSEGSTIINFKGEYFATLSNGTHKLEVVSTDGSAFCEFTVNITPEPDENIHQLSGEWVFNESIVFPSDISIFEYVNYSSNGVNYKAMEVFYLKNAQPSGTVVTDSESCFRYYEREKQSAANGQTPYFGYCVYSYSLEKPTYGQMIWYDYETDSKIDFGSEPQVVSEEFYEWFTANATKNG